MSAKRRATSDLNHDNWDMDEKEDDEMGNFKMASEDVLEKRVIKTARRRTKIVGDETKKPAFSGFGGFNKTQPSSFDFLANLTNGNKMSNISPAKTENSTQPNSTCESSTKISSGSIFTSTSPNFTNTTFGKQSTLPVSMFGIQSSSAAKSAFGIPASTITTSILQSPISASLTSAFIAPSSTAVSSVFGTPSTIVPSVFGTPSTTVSSVFGTTSPTTSSVFGSSPSAVTSVFKSPSSAVTTIFGTTTSKDVTSVFGATTSTLATSVFSTPTSTAIKTDSIVNENPFKIQVTSTSMTSNFNIKPEVSNSKVSSSIFGMPTTNFSNSKSLVTLSNSTPFQIKSTNLTQTSSTPETKVDKTNGSNLNTEKVQDKKLIYFSNLKGLNESVAEWITKHLQETPFCILTPIFKDYEAYLKKIQEEYEGKNEKTDVSEESTSKNISPLVKSPLKTRTTVATSTTPISSKAKSIFGSSVQNVTQSPNFSFGFTSTPCTNTTSTGFSFGVSSTQSTTTTTSPFAINNSTLNNSDTNGKTPFSFRVEKPFNLNSSVNIQSNTEKATENPEDDDEPPKVEFTPVVEENSIFDKRCKIFVKKDGIFVDNGVGTLYVKKIQNSTKHQLLVRANTNLGNLLLNLVLSSAIPTQRMGKNNVMLVCVPTPEAKPPPVPVLIRVKTSEEADVLLKTLEEYKV